MPCQDQFVSPILVRRCPSTFATKDQEPDVMSLPHIAFAFCYLAAHFGLDIVEGSKVEKLMDYVVAHERDLAELILQGVQ